MSNIFIGGCGRVGSVFAQTKAAQGHNVIAVDQDADSLKQLGANISAVEGSLLDLDVLKEASSADEIYLLTRNNNINLAAALTIKQLFNKKAVIKLNDCQFLSWIKSYDFSIINIADLVLSHIGCDTVDNNREPRYDNFKKGNHIVIVGGGEKATDLCRDLHSYLTDGKHTASAIEYNSELALELAKLFAPLKVYTGDGSNIDMLMIAGIQKAGKLAALSDADDVNFIACWIARNIFNVPEVVARVNHPWHIGIFELIGVKAINSTREFSNLISGHIINKG